MVGMTSSDGLPPADRPAAPAPVTLVEPGVPAGLRVVAGWSWRLLVIGVVGLYLIRLLGLFQVLIVPVLVALLLVALVRPMVDLLTRVGGRGLPRSVASLLTILVTLAVVGGLIGLISQQIAVGFPELQRQATAGLRELQSELARGPLHLSADRLAELVDRATAGIRANSDGLVSGALQLTSTAGHVVTGFFLVLFSGYFFLSGGREIWSWVVGLFPRNARDRVNGAGERAWDTLTSFVRATLLVALVDGLGVGVSAALLGVPLALPLGLLVFIGAFVPIVGALVSGSVAVLVALVAKGPLVAALMLAAVVVVQQVESHLLQPFLLGRAVRVHPLAVILAIGAGVLLAGVVGALFAVPTVAVVNVVAGYLAEPAGPLDPEQAAAAAVAAEGAPAAEPEPSE
jgi:putative heme transporter